MEKRESQTSPGRILLTVAAFVVVVAGMRAASSILVPFLLSVFIAIICAPPLFWMKRRKVPTALATLLLIIVILAAGLVVGAFVGTQLNAFSKAVPAYQQNLSGKTAAMITWLNSLGFEIAPAEWASYFDPGVVMKMAASTLTGLSGALTNAFLILLTVIFILLEASGFPAKLRRALDHPETGAARFAGITESINHYLALKTAFSLITGLTIWIWLAILGVDYPLLWGLVAFLLNYVPNIGSIIAAIPAILLALIELGPAHALLAAAGYLAVNVTIGSILEPRFMGRGLGLSSLVVFLSLVFWGWVLGPVGMLLSVPLTMILKIILESNAETRWIAVLLGSEPRRAPLGRRTPPSGQRDRNKSAA